MLSQIKVTPANMFFRASAVSLLAVLSTLHVSFAQLTDVPPELDTPTFTDVTKEVGLDQLSRGMMGHAAAWGDADGDGRVDLFIGTFTDRPEETYQTGGLPTPNLLLRNTGAGFERVVQPEIEALGRASGSVFADFDNDGDLDLYVANNSVGANLPEPRRSRAMLPNLFYENLGNGQYKNISQSSGATPPEGFIGRNVGVLDYDLDGLLDLLLIEDRFRNPRQPRSILLRNLGGLKFEEVNEKVGLPNNINGLGLAVADLNGDGRPDFYVAQSNRLFVSQPDNTYKEATELKELFDWRTTDGEDVSCGAAFGDIDRDGDFDLVVGNHFTPARNRLYLNDGVKDGMPIFRDITKEAGLSTLVPTKAPHVEIADMNNDGLVDIFMSSMFVDGEKIEPLIYRNVGIIDGLPRFVAPSFEDKTMRNVPTAPTADYDNDGDLDIALVSFSPRTGTRLLRNEIRQTHPERGWLQVQVTGTKMNRMGIGAIVRVYHAGSLGQANALMGMQEIATGYGYSSGQPAICHFGLSEALPGQALACDVEIEFPGNPRKMRLQNVAANQVLKVTEE